MGRMTTGADGVSSTPARDRILSLADGRQVAVAEWGGEGGRPVVLCHGNPGSRLICPDLGATLAAGIHLIAVDRPGIGGSTPRVGFTLRDTADDLAEVLGHLDVDRCTVLGWSAGAHQALALGGHHPELVTEVLLAGGPGPPDDPEVVAQRSDAAVAVIDGLRAGSGAATAEVARRFQGLVDDPAAILRRTLADDSDPDRRLMQDPAIAAFLVTMWSEGIRQGAAGLAAMWAAQYALPWGFAPEDLAVPVTIWHGVEDRVCPIGQAERLAARIPGARLRPVEGAGHLLPIEHWAAMLTTQ
jgi:pimeloyl-ACP methyl ester carboxylesterase